MAIRKAIHGKKNVGKNQCIIYYFDIEQCKNCPQAGNCYKAGAKSKTFSVSIKSELHQKQNDFQKTEYFKDLVRTRYKMEAKIVN